MAEALNGMVGEGEGGGDDDGDSSKWATGRGDSNGTK
jgi:hypothetical protein